MRKRKTVLLFLLLFSFSCGNKTRELTHPTPELIPKDAIIVCGDSKVLIVEPPEHGNAIPHIIWSWDAQQASDLPTEYRTKKFNSIDDCKPANSGKQLMVSSSSGAVAIVNIEDKKVIFWHEVPNAHSIEMLSGNKVVAAASTTVNGNLLMLFDLDKLVKLQDTDSLYSAHGVVWDNKRNVLFALGFDVLREYQIAPDNKLVMKCEWKIPGTSGHDLSMAPDGDNLFMTEHTGSWIFSIENQTFSKITQFPDAKEIKSINQNANRQFLYIIAEESWWTHQVKFFNPSGYLSFPDIRVYKARFYNVD